MRRCFPRYKLLVQCKYPCLQNKAYHQKHISMMATNSTSPAEATTSSNAAPKLRFADVGINLSDPVFQGIYHEKQVHENDLDDIIQRALGVGCTKMMVTGSDLTSSANAIALARKYPGTCYATVGIHPCSATSLDEHERGRQGAIAELATLAKQAREDGLAVAFGEFGLDYDRLWHADKPTQLACFEVQLELAVDLQLPLFLHSRAAAADFERLLRPYLTKLPKRGLVHSFTGTLEEMRQLVDLGFDIGVNGCSLKTEANLDVVRQIPLDRLQLETDGPWCGITSSHASAKHAGANDMLTSLLPRAVKKGRWIKGCMVKGRNEPCTIPLVAHVVASVKGIGVEEVCEAAWRNSTGMFGLGCVFE